MNNYYISWFIGALFYLYQYVLRSFPASIEYDLRTQFHLTAQEYSTMSSYLLFFYALMQIPIGLLLDRIGVKKILATSIFISTIGTLTMANAKTLSELQISRTVIGIGSASAFMSTLKIIADYIPLKQQAMLMGSTLALGVSGNLFNVFYLIRAARKHNWSAIMEIVGVFGFILFMLSIFFVKLPAIKHNSNFKNSNFIKNSTIPPINPRILIYSILTIGLYIPLLALTDLWGISFISKKYTIISTSAATNLGMLSIALCISSLALPAICEKINQVSNAIRICTGGIFLIFGFILFGPIIDQVNLKLLLIMIGIFSGGSMLCFSQAVKMTNVTNSGVTIGIVNTLNMLAGSLLIQLVGYLLDIQWSGQIDSNQIRSYNISQYVIAITPLWIIIGLSFISSIFFIKK